MSATSAPDGFVFLLHVVAGLVEAKEDFGCSLEKRLSLWVGNFGGVLASVGGDVVEHLLESGDMMARIGFWSGLWFWHKGSLDRELAGPTQVEGDTAWLGGQSAEVGTAVLLEKLNLHVGAEWVPWSLPIPLFLQQESVHD